MQVDLINVQAFTISGAPQLDPLNVVLQDLGGGRGRLIVECYGEAWSAYWNAMGRSLIGFVHDASPEYLCSSLARAHQTETDEAYLLRISRAVVNAMKQRHQEGSGT